jgi:TatD DNase family protein
LVIDECRPHAVGEIGLDFYDKSLNREKQEVYFSKQVIIAKRHQLPVIIHCRKAHDECLQLLKRHAPRGGIIHAFNGSIQQAEQYIQLGFKLGFGGMLTYERSSKLRKLATDLPLDAIVLETDAPDMVVAAHRGQRNSPAYLPMIAKVLAELRNLTVSEVAETTTHNFHNVFD